MQKNSIKSSFLVSLIQTTPNTCGFTFNGRKKMYYDEAPKVVKNLIDAVSVTVNMQCTYCGHKNNCVERELNCPFLRIFKAINECYEEGVV